MRDQGVILTLTEVNGSAYHLKDFLWNAPQLNIWAMLFEKSLHVLEGNSVGTTYCYLTYESKV